MLVAPLRIVVRRVAGPLSSGRPAAKTLRSDFSYTPLHKGPAVGRCRLLRWARPAMSRISLY